jgi:Lipocalin-like domain
MAKPSVNELRTGLIGSWTLDSYQASIGDGSNVTFPFGVDARGIIMYTPDGYMSAQVMRSGRWPFKRDDPHGGDDNELAAAAGTYLTYAGPYTVIDDGLIAHHVQMSLLPNWIGATQYRTVKLTDARLELSPPEPFLIDGELRTAKLTWRRA